MIPPIPIDSTFNSYIWQEWYNKVRNAINQASTIYWTQLDFAGSSLSDIQTRPHSALQSLQGGTTGEYYHLTSSQHTNLTGGIFPGRSKAGDPTTSDISAGNFAVYKNTSSGNVKLWYNDSGTLKSVALV